MNYPPCPQCHGTDIGIAWATQEQAQLFCRACDLVWLEDLENEADVFSDLPESGMPYSGDLKDPADRPSEEERQQAR